MNPPFGYIDLNFIGTENIPSFDHIDDNTGTLMSIYFITIDKQTFNITFYNSNDSSVLDVIIEPISPTTLRFKIQEKTFPENILLFGYAALRFQYGLVVKDTKDGTFEKINEYTIRNEKNDTVPSTLFPGCSFGNGNCTFVFNMYDSVSIDVSLHLIQTETGSIYSGNIERVSVIPLHSSKADDYENYNDLSMMYENMIGTPNSISTLYNNMMTNCDLHFGKRCNDLSWTSPEIFDNQKLYDIQEWISVQQSFQQSKLYERIQDMMNGWQGDLKRLYDDLLQNKYDLQTYANIQNAINNQCTNSFYIQPTPCPAQTSCPVTSSCPAQTSCPIVTSKSNNIILIVVCILLALGYIILGIFYLVKR